MKNRKDLRASRGTFQIFDSGVPFPFNITEKLFMDIIQKILDRQKGVRLFNVNKIKCKCFNVSECIDWFVINFLILVDTSRTRGLKILKMFELVGFVRRCDPTSDILDDVKTHLFFTKQVFKWKDHIKFAKRLGDFRMVLKKYCSTPTNTKLFLSTLTAQKFVKDDKGKRAVKAKHFVDWLMGKNNTKKAALCLGQYLLSENAFVAIYHRRKFTLGKKKRAPKEKFHYESSVYFMVNLSFQKRVFSKSIKTVKEPTLQELKYQVVNLNLKLKKKMETEKILRERIKELEEKLKTYEEGNWQEG